MKNLNSVLLLLAVALLAVLLYFDRCDSPQIADSSKVDSIKVEIQKRDSFIIDRDTVVYRVTQVRETIREYHLTHDTLTKIILCDSLAVACDSLAVQYGRQDSIFREQIGSYTLLVSVQDSLLKVKPKRRWIIIPVPIPFRRR